MRFIISKQTNMEPARLFCKDVQPLQARRAEVREGRGSPNATLTDLQCSGRRGGAALLKLTLTAERPKIKKRLEPGVT